MTVDQLFRVFWYDQPMQLDDCNYHYGRFCPLAVGLGLDQIIKTPSDTTIVAILSLAGYTVFNTRNLEGDFYRDPHRHRDLLSATADVICEKIGV